VKPAGAHREPDGTSTVEQLEPDAGMATSPDRTPDRVPSSIGPSMSGSNPGPAGPQFSGSNSPAGAVKTTGPSYAVQRMHDTLCAAFPNDAVRGEYPALKSFADAVDPAWFAARAAEHTLAGKAKKAARANFAWNEALTLKGLDPDAVDDGRALLHKSFSDMYPALHLSPGDSPRPGSYQRPYLAAGHAAANAAHNGGSNIPRSAHTPEPEDFHRPLITDGHQQDSPANKDDSTAGQMGDIRNQGQVRTGASRTYYTNAQREAARVAMQNIHDHISQNFPEMCSMAASKAVMPPDMGANNVPTPSSPHVPGGVGDAVKNTGVAYTQPEVTTGLELQQQIADAIRRHTARVEPPAMTRKQLAKAAATLGYDLIERPDVTTRTPDQSTGTVELAGLTAAEMKALLAEQITPLAERYETAFGAMQKQLDDIAAEPDPRLAPVRGALAKGRPEAVPVERRSLVDEARDRAAYEETGYRRYVESLTKSPDPGTRERALSVLAKLAGADAA
jgi:hypothetical protein